MRGDRYSNQVDKRHNPSPVPASGHHDISPSIPTVQRDREANPAERTVSTTILSENNSTNRSNLNIELGSSQMEVFLEAFTAAEVYLAERH